MVTAQWVIPRCMLQSLYPVSYYKFLKTSNSEADLMVALDRVASDHAFSVRLAPRAEPCSLWSTGKLHVITEEKFSTISIKYVKTTSSCHTKKVLFAVIFAAHLRSFRILRRAHCVSHLPKIVVSYVLRPNSITCPNAAQNIPLRNFKK